MSVSLWREERLIFIIWDVLDEDAAGTIGRKRDNNVFITKFLIIVQIKVIVMMLLLVLTKLALLNFISCHTWLLLHDAWARYIIIIRKSIIINVEIKHSLRQAY